MDTNQPTGQTGQPSSGGTPPQQPYQPPAQQSGIPGGYQQAPLPPPPQKKGFNWLACCGITCVVLFILGGGMVFCTYQMAKPFIEMTTELASLSNEVISNDVATMKASAIPVDAIALSTSPDQYTGQWLELEGELSHNSFTGTSAFSSGDFNTEDCTNYVIRNVLVMDVDRSPAVGNAGDRIRAYGKAYALHLSAIEKIPFIGKPMVDEFRKDPMLAGQDTMIFFLCKGIHRTDVAAVETDGGDEGGSDDETSDDSSGNGWVR